MSQQKSQTLPFYLAGIPSAVAAACTHPLDFFKIRLQTQGASKLIPTLLSVAQEEGIRTFYNGLSASLLRQMTYSTTRFGVYETMAPVVKTKYYNGEDLPLYAKILVSGTAGALGGLVGTPADVVNIKMQAHRGGKGKRLYSHALDGLVKIARKDGILSLWRGVIPNINRAILMTASQIATYGQVKEALLRRGFENDLQTSFWPSVWTHFVASFIAGFVATTVCSPVDNIKTRLMNSERGQYKGMLDCGIKVLKKEGPVGFLKGFFPSWIRLAPQTVLTMIVLEQVKHLALD